MGVPLERSTLLLTTCGAMVAATAALTWRVSTVYHSLTTQGLQIQSLRTEMTGSAANQVMQLQSLRTEMGVRLESLTREQDRLREDFTNLRNQLSSAQARPSNGSDR